MADWRRTGPLCFLLPGSDVRNMAPALVYRPAKSLAVVWRCTAQYV
jgi:hypothetical protein